MMVKTFTTLVLSAAVLVLLPACVQADKADGAERPPPAKVITLPQGFAVLTHSELLALVEPNHTCEASAIENKERYLRLFDLTGGQQLMAVACDIGAYQDEYLLYRLANSRHSDLDKPITATKIYWQEPYFDSTADNANDGRWQLKINDKLRGSLTVDAANDELDSLRLYASTGLCGYQVKYALTGNLLEPIKPSKLHADNDCENAQVVDQWPALKLN